MIQAPMMVSYTSVMGARATRHTMAIANISTMGVYTPSSSRLKLENWKENINIRINVILVVATFYLTCKL